MPWSADGGWREPWLPLASTSRNVAEQRGDSGSTLHFTRDLIALRRSLDDLRAGAYVELSAPAGAWAWQRGDSTLVAVNLGEEPVEIVGIDGSIALSTDRGRYGEHVTRSVSLGPAEGVVVVGG